MRNFAKAALSVAVVAFAASISLAQGRPGGGGGQMDGPVLLLNKSVQDELKLTDDQKADLKKVGDKMKESMQKAFTDNPGKDGKEKRDAAIKEITEDTTKTVTKTIDGLKDAQKTRFKQIQVQVKGLRAFSDEAVAKTLNLTDKQKDEIKTATEDLAKDVREIMMAAGRDPEKRAEAQKKAAELTTKATDKVVSSLSDEQKKTWKELTGDKFDYKAENLFPGGGGKKGGDKSF
jgi:Spy/CpxP family protein refolding chaperone